jgi:hypothetical protein
VDDPALTTVEWSSAPVSRPENSLTGVSFRNGAGTWGPSMPLMREESYTARFAGHWAFEGTGLTDGDKFGQGSLGYEIDAAEFTEVMGVPRVTCRDGTPASFVVLATADLRHWSSGGQGGWATMGVFSLGRGTVSTRPPSTGATPSTIRSSSGSRGTSSTGSPSRPYPAGR